eukprot:TRINITY_DN1646_c0_g1_i1.p1 TRINITY_DN1646_c0_g1~~TRINITY_DN1646_c0_g1_i1.p1  ORF type:complete len:2220 (-),score=642.37 TRINITY_DN1646_c0_g1_i1:15-6674(-)
MQANIPGSPAPHHDAPTYHRVKDYVDEHGGNKVIETILIANNGIAAVKCMISIRKWAYATFGDERAIQFVVMATPEDLKANAEYIRMADQIEEVSGGSNVNNYANVDLIVEIAERRGVQAVWAGWGHASENPRLPETLANTHDKIAFIGPPATAMHDLGDKIASTLIAQSANVNCVPWNGTGITVNYAEEGIPEATYRSATVATLEETIAAVQRIGYPVMIKASEGGGGKGIRKVISPETLEASFRQVQGEVPGSPIFIMKMVSNARHLEVQVLADQYNQAIALYGRDCSVQRRHQKIIEEGPPIIAPKDTWEEMERAAVRMTRTVGYVGVGTVEYLFVPETNEYFFLELNPRLQVEHPVTELITNVNLVAAQVNVAMGIPLNRIRDIRRFYMQEDLEATNKIDFDVAPRAPPRGHTIAVRITGENPDEGFKPTSGGIQELTFRSNSNVWGYFSVGTVGGLHEYADSQFGHIFSHGATRDESRRDLIVALKNLSIRGDISTIVAYGCFLLETDVFKRNAVTTGWLDGLIEKAVHEEKPDTLLVVVCGALFRAFTQAEERYKQYIAMLDRGQTPPKELLRIEETIDLIYLNTKYTFSVRKSGQNCMSVSLTNRQNTNSIDAEVRPLGDGGFLILLNGRSNVCYGSETVTGLKLMINGRTCMFSTEYDPTKLRVTTAGKLVRYLVENGAHVKVGTPYAEMEVMKMYLPLVATESGRITFTVPEGSILESGAIVATFQLDDSSKVRTATIYEGDLPKMKAPRVKGEKAHQQLRESIASITAVLGGYYHPDPKNLVRTIVKEMFDPELPLLEFRESISRITSRMPKDLHDSIVKELQDYQDNITRVPFSGARIRSLIDTYVANLPSTKQKEVLGVVGPVLELCDQYASGLDRHADEILSSFFKEYLAVEKVYQGVRDDVIAQLRSIHKSNLRRVFEIDLGHHSVTQRNKLMLNLLDAAARGLATFSYLLHELSDLNGPEQLPVSLRARRMLITHQFPSFEQLRVSMERDLLAKQFNMLLSQAKSIFHILTSFFWHNSVSLRETAIEVYIRRAYHAYEIKDMKVSATPKFSVAEWHYVPPDTWTITSPIPISDITRSPPESSPKASPHQGKQALQHHSMTRVQSDYNLKDREAEIAENTADLPSLTRGVMFAFKNEEEAIALLPGLLSIYFKTEGGANLSNVLNVCIQKNEEIVDSVEIPKLRAFVQNFTDSLRQGRVRRVTVMLTKYGNSPKYYTYRERLNYDEHPMYRHIEPPMSFHLELQRLANYEIQRCSTENHQIHLYYAESKSNGPTESHACFFARALIRGAAAGTFMDETESVVAEAEYVLNESLQAIEVSQGEKRFKSTWNNHIFMKFILDFHFNPDKVVMIINGLAKKFEKRFGKLKVGTVEICGKLKKSLTNQSSSTLRFVITNPTGFRFDIDAYLEVKDADNRRTFLRSLFGTAEWDGKDIQTPYVLPSPLQRKRLFAQQQNTPYAYDVPDLVHEAVRRAWEAHFQDLSLSPKEQQAKIPRRLTSAVELVLNATTEELEEVERARGLNRIGMVAWKINLITPECPQGRDIIVIANDITLQIGSFGVKEDVLFKKASEMARLKGLPRIYIAANSGARIGLAQEVMDKFRVSWIDPENPQKGFNHIYLTDDEYANLSKIGSVNARRIGTDMWQLTDIIGVGEDLGVENLTGSGMIAGETSQAYNETFTLTLVTGRTVGIGAYLVRLGQRTIQHKGPIILTGASALNKVLGKKVYSSNVQLGGTQIMFANGVSHLTADNEVDAVSSIVTWLSYVPSKIGARLPILVNSDPVDRPIDFTIVKNQPYDPRHMLAGQFDTSGKWTSGFFDKGSFVETLAGWAKTVVCGRARLGGIPMGVIAVETRTIEQVEPADPAVNDSHESVTPKAGQVWFPDSAYKTAQAIEDFNKGEQLPLMIFANWRGFSGGLRDLFDEILKYGSYIVDNLREYKQPVFVYIPPFGELRGGAWVVVDSTINPEKMEMYCDENGRGGVLEPNGTIEIKYKEKDLLKTMHRLDERLRQLDAQLKNLPLSDDKNTRDNLAKEEAAILKAEVAARERSLLPIYEQIAIHFADLHDTPGRMLAKGSTRGTLSWKTSRTYFYNRVKRRMEEEYLYRDMTSVHPLMSHREKVETLKKWIAMSQHLSDEQFATAWNDDVRVAKWFEDEREGLTRYLETLRADHVRHEVSRYATQDPEAAAEGLLRILTPQQKEALLARLSKS